jgi:endo-1,4-beta-xylanase
MSSPLVFDRRGFLGAASGAGAALLTAGTPLAAAPSIAGLDAVARRHGMRFGTCLGKGGFVDERNPVLVAAQCGLITPENELKWQATRPSADRFDFAAADRVIGWATQHGLGVRGHTLLWHRQERFPAWLNTHDFGANPASAAQHLLTEHIRTVASRYASVIHSFDVVNETVDPDTGALRETNLSRAFGGTEPMLDLAFHTARATVPGAQLVYNDYMGWEDGSEKHRAGVLRLLEGFKARGVPVDALGLQSHIAVDPQGTVGPHAARREKAWRDFLDAVTGMGYNLLITEFDVDDRTLPADIALRDRAVADDAQRYLDVTLSYPRLDTIVAWGLVDRFSWLQNFHPRTDGVPKRPNPWDSDFRPKLLRDAIAQAITHAPARKA